MKRKVISATLVLLMFGVTFGTQSSLARAAGIIYVPDNYATIQAAVNAASPGDTIIVRSGTYSENVVINKSLSLIGENRASTIDGNGIGSTIRVTANNVVIRDFTVRNAQWSGIFLDFYSSNNTLIGNKITNNDSGIVLQDSSRNKITNNIIENNTWNGIHLVNNEGEWGNQIIGNNITGNYNGVNSYDIGKIYPNIFYLNNFTNNTRQVFYYYPNPTDNWSSPEKITYTSNNITYTSYLGNYWSDYTGSDANGDGVGDTPYNINSDNDSYPLISPFGNYVIFVPGDANGDGVVDALDITKIEKIIIGLDAPTPGANANQDGNVNAIDITKVERIIAGLG